MDDFAIGAIAGLVVGILTLTVFNSVVLNRPVCTPGQLSELAQASALCVESGVDHESCILMLEEKVCTK